MELAPEVKFISTFTEFTRRWWRTLTNGSDVKYVFPRGRRNVIRTSKSVLPLFSARLAWWRYLKTVSSGLCFWHSLIVLGWCSLVLFNLPFVCLFISGCEDGQSTLSAHYLGRSNPYVLRGLSRSFHLCINPSVCVCGHCFVPSFSRTFALSFARLHIKPCFFCFSCQILVDYPTPENHLCIVRLWVRHLGFGLVYTSLLLKTWR